MSRRGSAGIAAATWVHRKNQNSRKAGQNFGAVWLPDRAYIHARIDVLVTTRSHRQRIAWSRPGRSWTCGVEREPAILEGQSVT